LGEYTSRIEPGWLAVTELSLHLPRLESAFDGYRIAHITDTHADNTWMDMARLMDVVQLTNQYNPDLVVITGDFVTVVNAKTFQTLSALSHLNARDGILAVLGNHDHSTDPGTVRAILQSNSIRELKNTSLTLLRGNAQLHIIGLDDLLRKDPQPSIWSFEGRLHQALSELPETGAALLLVHEPDFADVAGASGRVDLQLSGHSHGGQICLPFYGPLITPPLGRKYPTGLYSINGMFLYTNRGVGMTGLPIRFNCRPEISIFTLHTL
jgi:predicted MPP superfamily phosphohydrolase